MADEIVKKVQVVATLTLGDCPLLEDSPENRALIDAFNQAVAQFAIFPRAFGEDLAQDPTLVELSEKLRKIGQDLTKQHYSIGFIGPTQNGKSTALNYVLDVTQPRDQPCREGGGDNTTSTMSRIRQGQRGVKLIYMNQAQFENKRKALCLASGLNPGSDEKQSDDKDLLSRIPQRLVDVEQGSAPVLENGKEILPHDVVKLQQLLNARRSDPSLIDSPPQQVDYARREIYLNYVEQAHRANSLLQEAQISFDSAYLPTELEMYDLPGPGAKSTIDEWTTRQYLPQMNGVMLFVEVTKLGNEVVERLYSQLRSQFRDRVNKRVWIVLTRWDSPQYAALVGDRRDTTFSAIKAFMLDKDLPASQIRFVCAPWYKRDNQLTVAHFRGILQTDSPYPETLPATDELYPRFTELLDKGGILSLRELVLNVIPHDVRQEIMDAAQSGLAEIRAHLKRRLSNEVRKRTALDDQADQASQCGEALKQLLIRIKRDLSPFEKAAADLRAGLRETFGRHCGTAEVLDEYHEVPTKFPIHTRKLEERLLGQVQTSIIPELYRLWQSDFDSLPDLKILESPTGEMLTLGQMWRSFGTEEGQPLSHINGQFPSFLDSRLFAKGGDPRAEADLEKGAVYRAMMEEKICLTAQQAVHAVRNALQERGLRIKRELDQLISAKGSIRTTSEVYASFIAEMGELAG